MHLNRCTLTLMRIHHVALPVTDLEISARFYSDILKLPEVKSPREGARWFDLDGTILMLERAPTGTTNSSSLNVLALTISHTEREEWKHHLASRGVAVTKESPYSLYLTDPDGHRLALSHYPNT